MATELLVDLGETLADLGAPLITRTGLDVGLEASYLLDEQSGTVAINQVRGSDAMGSSGDFSEVSYTTDSSGPLPVGYIRYENSVDPLDDTYSQINADGSYRLHLTCNASPSARYGIYWPNSVTPGTTYRARVRYKIVEQSGSGAFSLFAGTWKDATGSVGEWVTEDFVTTASTIHFYLAAACPTTVGSFVTVDIDYVELFPENAGTYDRDASNTYTAISDLGSIDGGQDFNGSSDSVTAATEINAVPSISSPFSVSLWVKPTADVTTEQVFFGNAVSSSDRFAIGIKAGALHTSFYNGSFQYQQEGTAVAETWTHVVVTYDGSGDCRLFIDAARQPSASTTIFQSSAVRTTIGCSNNYSTFFAGSLSNVYIYSRALTGPEVAQLYAQGPTALVDVGRVAHYLLEETSGDVCRNQIRTTIYDDDFTGGSTTTADGDVPTGWTAYKSAVLPTFSLSDSGSTTTITADGEGSATAFVGIQKATGLTSGVAYVVVVRYRVLSRSGAPSLSVFGGAWQSKLLDSVALNEWQTAEFTFTAASAVLAVAAGIFPSSEAIVLEIDSIEVTAENAGTSTSDMSTLTTTGVVGRGANLDGTDYISAPWNGGFTYPTTVACAFKLDTLTSAAPRTLISLTDASASDVYWQFGVTGSGANTYISRRNTTAVAQNVAAALTTNWHTVVVVFHDETSYSVYFDGTLLTTQTGLTSVSASANVDTLLVGLLRLIGPTEYADGITFDEVSAWTRELSAEDAAEWHQFTIFPLAARHSAEPLGLETSFSL